MKQIYYIQLQPPKFYISIKFRLGKQFIMPQNHYMKTSCKRLVAYMYHNDQQNANRTSFNFQYFIIVSKYFFPRLIFM